MASEEPWQRIAVRVTPSRGSDAASTHRRRWPLRIRCPPPSAPKGARCEVREEAAEAVKTNVAPGDEPPLRSHGQPCPLHAGRRFPNDAPHAPRPPRATFSTVDPTISSASSENHWWSAMKFSTAVTANLPPSRGPPAASASSAGKQQSTSDQRQPEPPHPPERRHRAPSGRGGHPPHG